MGSSGTTRIVACNNWHHTVFVLLPYSPRRVWSDEKFYITLCDVHLRCQNVAKSRADVNLISFWFAIKAARSSS